MAIVKKITVFAAILGVSTASNATTYAATSANFASIFYSAPAGDRIILSGNFGALQLRDRSFATALTIDARKARFTDSLMLKNVSGVNFSHGTFGSTTSATRMLQAVVIAGGSNIKFTSSAFVGNGIGTGLAFTNVDNISVSRSTFTSLHRGLAFTGVTNGIMDRNKFIDSTSDGAGIVNSHFVTASNNSCSGTEPSPGAHPDCIQMWSLAGNPVQSDITIKNNLAVGETQGFTSFDAIRGGGLRISMLGNRVDTSYPQGIACYGCVDSLFANNVLTTQFGALYRTSINIVGGSNNVLRDNSVGALSKPQAKTATFAEGGSSQSSFDDMGTNNPALSEWGADSTVYAPLSANALATFAVNTSVPEPGTWLQMLAGMTAIGWMARQRRRIVAA